MKHTGDGLSAWFTSGTSACECALAIRDDLADHNLAHPQLPLHVRFGIASGAPIPRERDLFGVSVTLAARLCAQAVAGQVLVSSDVTRRSPAAGVGPCAGAGGAQGVPRAVSPCSPSECRRNDASHCGQVIG